MERRDFLKLTTLGGLISAYPTIALASGHGDNFILGDTIKDSSKAIVEEIFKSNDYYSKSKGPEFFEAFKMTQHPRATIIGCSDSRFQENSIDRAPENDLFVVRNIGNQQILLSNKPVVDNTQLRRSKYLGLGCLPLCILACDWCVDSVGI